ncbi:MAG: type II CRISPR RNA-guided endonuclease Cas9 [Bacteroidetes bacterium]|nr:type II CRISPR RNA-guided endonuclease Cas9 [Bacteroidota bacterium]
MSRILGLDLGVSSIGWAVIDEDEKKILGMGSRIIPLTTEDKDEFTKGNAISKNQKRTLKRTQRKGYDRYQLRRQNLISILKQYKMLPDIDLIKLNKLDLWKLRAEATNKKLTLQEIGRVLLHLNQKRGYKSSRSEANLNKKDTEYVTQVKSRYEELKEKGLTIGEKFFIELNKDQYYRIKEQVFPREAYIEEFDKIINKQREFYTEILTDEIIDKIRNEIIYYQRKLKSQKGLVSICEFEGFWTKLESNGKIKELFVGPKVAPKSSPLFQVCKIWENINNITLKRKTGETIEIAIDKKHEIFEYMNNNEKLTFAELLKILGLKKDDVYGNKQLTNGLQGNKTKIEIINCFNDLNEYEKLLGFDLIINESDEEGYLVDKESGEIIEAKKKKQVAPDIEFQPFYTLWHTIYSISDKEECKNALIKNFNINEVAAQKLSALDFTKQGFGNKSHRSIRKILPFLIEGDNYSTACSYAGYNHSNSLTTNENLERKLLNKLKQIDKNSLRQPVVEKILNQMVNVVNAIIDKYGKPNEIRIELARELKQSRDERNETYKYMNERERENQNIEKELSEFGLRATRNNIIKWRLYHEISNYDKKQNAICIYCGKAISFTAAILGEETEVEHIIPRSKLFDDSQSNKTLAHRKCNSDKKDQTAYDYMRSKSENEFNDYVERINTLYKSKVIGKTKRDKLLMPGNKIPNDFIDRQLRETQYISKKAREILTSICHNVWTTSGSVTSELRHIWGWDEILENLQIHKYRDLGLTETIEIKSGDKIFKKEKINGWSKRDDHRHHAIDALTIACTKQGFIHRFNKLNSSKIRNDMKREIDDARFEYNNNKSLLENYIYSKKPYSTKDVEKEAQKILISFKPGKKAASIGKRKIKKDGKKVVVQTGIIVPRGPLSEESVYGKIKIIEKKQVKYLFENPHLIYKTYIKNLVEERLYLHDGDPKSAITSLKKEPIYLNENKTITLEYGSCFKEEYVIKYPIASIKAKDIPSIVDKKVREIIDLRLSQFDYNEKEAFKDIDNNPVWYNEKKKIPIKTVRCLTGLSAVEPIKANDNGKDIAFVKPGNNHHLALYLDEFGNKQLSICSFWHAVERKKFGLPVIIKNPSETIDKILDEDEDKYSDNFLEKLPNGKWTFLESFQQNEMFILGMDKDVFEEARLNNDYPSLSDHLYRVQKLFYNGKQLEIFFRFHLETQLINDNSTKLSKRYYQIQSLGALESLNPQKLIINCLGEIITNK